MCPRLPTPAPSSPTICRCTGKKGSFGRAGLAIPRSTLAQWVVVDVMEELVKFTLLVRGRESYLVDRYSERKESAASQLVAGVVSTGGGQGCRAG